MPEEVNKDQTKAAKQEKTPELTDDELDEAVGGLAIDAANEPSRLHPELRGRGFEDTTRSLGSG